MSTRRLHALYMLSRPHGSMPPPCVHSTLEELFLLGTRKLVVHVSIDPSASGRIVAVPSDNVHFCDSFVSIPSRLELDLNTSTYPRTPHSTRPTAASCP